MYKARINNQSFDIDLDNNGILLNQKELNLSMVKLEDGGYEVTYLNEKMIADIVKIDRELKQIILRIKNKKYCILIKEDVDLMLERLGIQTKSTKKMNSLKSPMPGLVTKVLVKQGDEIKQGEPLMILEAMKMENVFKAAMDVRIKFIKVVERQAVEKGEELISFE